jgi:lysophospholipase L1-like esterase
MTDRIIGHRVCFFGDSLVNGVRDAQKGGWPMRLGQSLLNDIGLDATIYNLGIRAETSSDLKNRWYDDATRRKVDEFPLVLVFCFGLNDANHAQERGEETTMRVSHAQSLANATDIMTRAREMAPTLWVGPQAVIDGGRSSKIVNERLEGLNQLFAETARGLEIPYFDVFERTRNDETWQRALRRGDGYHPDTAGYDLLAEMIWQWQGWRDVFAMNG